MNTQTLRNDMKIIESGINLSNMAKKENCLAKVGASITLGLKPIDPRQGKKIKNLKQFLRRKRGINYYTSPSPLFNRNKVNQTHIKTQMKPPVVFWTVQLKFIGASSQNESWLQ